MRAQSRNLLSLESNSVSLIDQFTKALNPKRPYDSIIDFATHQSFCGLNLYPRQQTLLKLIYLETENMSAYDIDVIEEWREGFQDPLNPMGVQEDIWERVEYLKSRGYSHFPHVQSVLGRRASKGRIGGILGAERMAYLISLENPQAHYGIAEGKSIYLPVVATNLLQAKKFQFADVRETVERCVWLQDKISTSNEYSISLRTPEDLRYIADMESKRLPIEREIASIRAEAMSSSSSSGRGGTSMVIMFDEFAHMLTGTSGPRTSEEVWDAYTPSVDQFGKDSLIYIPSSPLTKIGKFYELYQAGKVTLPEYNKKKGRVELKTTTQDDVVEELEEFEETVYADPELLIVQLPSWGLYQDWEQGEKIVGVSFPRAIQYPPSINGSLENKRMARLEKRNPEKFKVERRGQFSEVVDGYLNPMKVDQMFDPFNGRTLVEQTSGRMGLLYEGHADPGATNANFAYCLAHLEDAKEPDEYGHRWKHVVIDKLQIFSPRDFEDDTVDYILVQEQLKQELLNFRSLNQFTLDQWNSISIIANLKNFVRQNKLKTRVREVNFNQTRNKATAEKFKSALNLGWIHSYKDTLFSGSDIQSSLLENELKFLTQKNGVVKKQEIGPVTTKDLADAVMEVSVRLLSDQLDHWARENLSSTQPAFGGSGGFGRSMDNDRGPYSDYQQFRQQGAGIRANDNAGSVRERLGGLSAGSRGEGSGIDRLRGRRA